MDGQPVSWAERVQVVRSRALAQRPQATLAQRLAAAEAALRALTPAPGRGKRQICDEAAWHAAVASVLQRYDVGGLLHVMWERQETAVTRYGGRGRGRPERPTRTMVRVRYVIPGVQRDAIAMAAQRQRLGWRVQVTNAPADRLSRPQAVRH